MNSSSKAYSNEIREIDNELNKYKHSYKMFIRLSVVKMVKQGYTRGEAADAFNVHRKSAEKWVKIYNKEGLSGLEPDYSRCGVNSKLSDEQMEELKKIVTDPENNYDVMSVKKLIEEKYGVKYTRKQIWVILRKKFGLNYDENSLILK